jgi:hypothetical protein
VFAGTRPIDTAPTAAVPINVNTTRRERFMAISSAWREAVEILRHSRPKRASESASFHGIVRRKRAEAAARHVAGA